jgi:hypothetical protein
MNDNFSGRDGSRGQGNFRTHRSERYRHPERDSNYDFDDYGASARGGYGNESYGGTWGNQGNEMAGSRNVTNQDIYGAYSTSRNYGNMGSYGGAQGFGTSRGGNIAQRHYGAGDTNYNFESGMGNPREARNSGYSPGGHRAYGYQSDYDSHGSGMDDDDRSSDLYGSDTSRRLQGSRRDRYDFNQDDYNEGSRSYRGSGNRGSSGYGSSFRDRDRDRGDYTSPNYGGGEGSYMGSGYRRSSQGDYGSGSSDYGSAGYYGGNSSLSNDQLQPYGLSGYYGGGYGDSNAGYVSADSNYISSLNRGRTIDRDRGDDRDRPYGGRY